MIEPFGCSISDAVPVRDYLRRLGYRLRAPCLSVVGFAHCLFVMLDHDESVPEVPKAFQGRQELRVVLLVKADRRLIEHIDDPGEVGADLGGQPDALGFTAREGRALSGEVQVAQADVLRNSRRELISFRMGADIFFSLSSKSRLERKFQADDIGRWQTSIMLFPPTSTESISSFSRLPLHFGQISPA